MAIVLTNNGKVALIEEERTFLNGCTLRLFVNNYVPVAGSVVGNFTECTDSGYAGFTPIGFAAATLNGSNQGQILAPAVTWTFTHDVGDFTVYGYYVTRASDGQVVYAERAASPFLVTAPGQTYTVVPKKVMDTM